MKNFLNTWMNDLVGWVWGENYNGANMNRFNGIKIKFHMNGLVIQQIK